jgi:hypothetical protein
VRSGISTIRSRRSIRRSVSWFRTLSAGSKPYEARLAPGETNLAPGTARHGHHLERGSGTGHQRWPSCRAPRAARDTGSTSRWGCSWTRARDRGSCGARALPRCDHRRRCPRTIDRRSRAGGRSAAPCLEANVRGS